MQETTTPSLALSWKMTIQDGMVYYAPIALKTEEATEEKSASRENFSSLLSTNVYCDNDPINNIDPTGLYSWSEFGHDVGNFWIGVGDGASFGITSWIRNQSWYGGDDYTNKCSGLYGFGKGTGRDFILTIVGGKILGKFAGSLKQWVRIGKSYSVSGEYTTWGVRWGASPKYLDEIPSQFFRDLNQALRRMHFPGGLGPRTIDPGHFHIFW